MITSAVNEPSSEEEEFEGFFAKSVFRSGYFVVAAIACVSATAYDLLILLRHWRVLPTGGAPLLLVIAGILIGFLWMSLAQHASICQLHKDGLISGVMRDTPLYTVLLITARTTINLLFYGSLGIASLLLAIDHLLSGYQHN